MFPIPSMKIDSLISINGKYPLCMQQYPLKNKIYPVKEPLVISMSQKLPVPENKEDSAKIILNYKTANLGTCMLKCVCIDDEENVVYQDSIDIKRETWFADTLTISLKNVHYLILGIFALGNEIQPKIDQKLWLDKMEILIGNRNYYNFNIPVFSDCLDDACLIPLDIDHLYSDIQIPKDKKIIALGESVHGSGSISYFQTEMLKKLIIENNCRLVILEGNIYSTPYWNLYIQGKLPKDKIEDIRLDVQFDNISDPDIFCDFLLWLREYNSNVPERKVYIAGNVDIVSILDFRDLLFGYINTYYNDATQKSLYPLLKLLNDNKLEEAQTYIVDNMLKIKDILGGDIFYNIFYYALSRKIANYNIKQLNQSMKILLSRDYSMFLNSREFIRMLLADDETATIVAHLGHTDKKNSTGVFPYIYPMGYYLHKYYDNSYYNIVFTVGTGNITSLKDITVADIKYPVDNSIEKLCMKKLYPYFYYHDYKHKPIHMLYRRIGNLYHSDEKYDFGDIHAKMDAFVFIRESKAFRNKNKLTNEKISEFMFDRGMERASLMRKYRKQNRDGN
jgi:erythromycin esterase-like protein